MTPYEKLDKRLEEIGGCGDGACIVHQRKGMHTNGGCKCSRQPFKMQQVIHAYKTFRKEVALERLSEIDEEIMKDMSPKDRERYMTGK